MRLYNLARGMAERGATGYQTAAAAQMTGPAFSEALNGRRTFLPEQKRRIAKFLQFPERWLFATIRSKRAPCQHGIKHQISQQD
jgi:hypothetical protein